MFSLHTRWFPVGLALALPGCAGEESAAGSEESQGDESTQATQVDSADATSDTGGDGDDDDDTVGDDDDDAVGDDDDDAVGDDDDDAVGDDDDDTVGDDDDDSVSPSGVFIFEDFEDGDIDGWFVWPRIDYEVRADGGADGSDRYIRLHSRRWLWQSGLYVEFESTPLRYLSYWFRVHEQSQAQAQAMLGPADGSSPGRIQSGPTRLEISEFDEAGDMPPVTIGDWHHVEVFVDYLAIPKLEFRVRMDGEDVPGVGDLARGVTSLHIGRLGFSQYDSGVDVDFDQILASTVAPDDADEGFTFIAPDLYVPYCNTWEQNCPEGEKCANYYYWPSQSFSNYCVAIADPAKKEGESCVRYDKGGDDCEAGQICRHIRDGVGRCVPICTGSFEEPICPDGMYCQQMNSDTLNVCISRCDPLLQNCPREDEVCIDQGTDEAFACSPGISDPHQPGEECQGVNSCAPGAVCYDGDKVPNCTWRTDCCSSYCDRTIPPEEQCLPGQECLGFFQGTVPGFPNVGICEVPFE